MFYKKIFYSFVLLALRALKINAKLGILRVSRIGHLSYELDAALTHLKATLVDSSINVILVMETTNVSNAYMLELIKRVEICRIKIINNRLLLSFVYYLESVNDKYLYINTYDNPSLYAKCFKGKPLFMPTQSEKDDVLNWFEAKNGIRSNLPYILLHNRDPAYLVDAKHHSFRDFSVDVLEDVISAYSDDYNFIRGGTVAIERLSENLSGCVDMPFIEHSPMVDIIAHKLASFYFGSDSGIQCVSLSFRKPVAMINTPPTSWGEFRAKNCYQLGLIPKKIYNKKSNQYVGLIEMYENNWVEIWDQQSFEEAQLSLINNSKDEVLNFFDNAVNIFESNYEKNFVFTDEQKEFWSIVSYYDKRYTSTNLVEENCFIDPHFLKKNKYLLN